MSVWLIDTGPIVAYLDRTDPRHRKVTRVLEPFAGRLITTSAVITEAMQLLADARNGPALLARFVEAADVQVMECTDAVQLRRAAGLMRKYADAPMDFADATLVLLADAIATTDIATLDRRGFVIYRTPSGRHFHLVV